MRKGLPEHGWHTLSLKIPVLDIYGSDEYPAVKRLAPQRLAAMEKSGNTKPRQIAIPDANLYFTGKADPLLQAAAEWLATPG